MDLLYFILCAFGLTNILVYGSIFNKIRPKHRFFHCPMCMGFWVGVFLLVTNHFTELFMFEHSPFNALLLGCLSSGTSYILAMLFGDKGVRHEIYGSQVGTATSSPLLQGVPTHAGGARTIGKNNG